MNLSKQISWRRISQREIRNSAAAEKSESESPPSPFGYGWASEGGQKFLPPNPLSFCPPERSDFCSAKGGAISQDFVQKRFELRSVIATKLDIFQIQRRLVARSPRRSLSRTAMRERVSLRKKPCPPALFQLRRVNILELNRKGGQIQIQFFGKANGGSELRSNSQMKFVSNFFRFLPKAKIQSKFLIPRFCAVGAMAKGDIIN